MCTATLQTVINGICQEPIARAVIPPRLQILRIDGEGMINDVIMTTAHDVICEKKLREKNVVGIVTFDLIGLLPTNHIIGYNNYYNDIPEFVRKRSVLTVK